MRRWRLDGNSDADSEDAESTLLRKADLHPMLQWDLEIVTWLVQTKEVDRALKAFRKETWLCVWIKLREFVCMGYCVCPGEPVACEYRARHNVSLPHARHVAAAVVWEPYHVAPHCVVDAWLILLFNGCLSSFAQAHLPRYDS